ncbi:lysogenization regulator HflD [Vespertiliibacter pulmonis]|uniref:High frequency lysogenization protein HflD homolog n=1 Tax=Vespertiliibacter pulmonis TaxID=1443036 RepID=A0A3N4W9U2_9PAST|nr:high frequency lysogenization protein HflD [Vespertiliibacter pulmonis]QLB20331.1 lysogenization regulator HflD [Vespertiliibacter pulmonis]RPE86317.1 high frequency lysogenization protein [Vespertiliibacter pulmonis]
MANYQDISIALAGVCQAVSLVQKFAHQGVAERESLSYSLQSLLVMQPESTLDVYDNQLEHLTLGFETLQALLGGKQGKLDTELGRYWVSVLALSQKLNKNTQAKSELAQRLQQLERQLSLYDGDVLHEQMIANMAGIYSDIISPLGSRIKVMGSVDFLARPDIQNRIRATLLAGIRAAILWQQVGGNRWQFLFARKKILTATQQLYASL